MGTAYRPLPILIFLLKKQHVGWAKRSVPIIFIWIRRMEMKRYPLKLMTLSHDRLFP
jgi:hypothetical protein